MPDPACPRCGAARHAGAVDCPRCIVFAKWQARAATHAVPAGPAAGPDPLVARLLGRDTPPPPAIVRAGRAALWVVLAVWSWRFLTTPIGPAVLDSFLHVVNLVFHEAGHILFSPFGRFLTVLGGSLMQLLVPAVCAGAFLWQQRDPFGAAVATWWLGQSLVDLAPYIGDARALELTLLGGFTGREVEGHDWEAILGTLGWLSHDTTLAGAAHGGGLVVMLLALGWGAVVLVGAGRPPAVTPG